MNLPILTLALVSLATTACFKKKDEPSTTSATPAATEAAPLADSALPADAVAGEAAEVASEGVAVSGEAAVQPAGEGSAVVTTPKAGAKADLEKALAASLDGIDARLAELEAKASQKAGSAQGSLAAELADLKAKREKAATELSKLKTAAEGAFDTLKAGVEAAFSELEAAVKKAEEALAH